MFFVMVTNKTHEQLVKELAQLQYESYCSAVGGVAFNGDPLPSAEEFFADESKKKQSNAWLSAAANGITFAEVEYQLEVQDFAWAVRQIKLGRKVQRSGWNGKDMWICRGEGCESLEADKFCDPHTREFAESNGGAAEVLPYILFKTADGKVLMGWLASQTDILADDWQLA